MKRISVQLFLITLLLFSGQLVASPVDSLRLEYADGKAFVIHQVDDGETLYSISRRYNSSMNAIAEASPEVKKGLHTGMIIKVPYKFQKQTPASTSQEKMHVVAQGETLYSISNIYEISVVEIMEWNNLLSSDLEIGQELVIKTNVAPPPPLEDYVLNGMKVHYVQAGEGLYAVARKYEVDVDDLVAWNDLQSSALNLGQELIVGKVNSQSEKAAVPEEPKPEVVETVVAGAAIVATVPENTSTNVTPAPENTSTNVTPAPENASTNVPPVPMVTLKENGMAASIEGSDDDNSYLALHRTLPIGNLIAVQNEMNNQVVFVRIVGKLPDTGVNEKIIIRLSPAAVKQLHAIDPKFRVEISYLVPK